MLTGISTRKAFVEPYVDLWLALVPEDRGSSIPVSVPRPTIANSSNVESYRKIRFIPGPSSAEMVRYPSLPVVNSVVPDVVPPYPLYPEDGVVVHIILQLA